MKKVPAIIRTDLQHAETRLSNRHEVERALSVRKDTYPNETICAVCGERWMAHRGELCPDSDGMAANYRAMLLGLPAEVLQWKPRGTTFVPLIGGKA